MKPRVYVETSVVSYLTARPARDIVVAGRQQSTRDWWAAASRRFELVMSELVLEEAGVGDPEAANARLAALAPLGVLGTSAEALRLTQRLVADGAVPPRAAQDAAHVAIAAAIAAAHGVEFLATWNFRHIANAAARRRIEAVCRDSGFEPPVLCAPDELTETEEVDDDR